MQMLERYLHAIAFWLPNDRQDDLIAEISEDLHAKIEDEQAKLGRKLTDAELEALLKRRGRPVLVASGYRQQQSLIGPVWFPAYVFVLKIVALCYVLPWVVVFVIVHRVQHPGLHWGATFLAAWGTAWTVSFVAAGVVTLIFALLERAETRTHFLEKWNPRQLPPARDPYKIPLSTSVTDLVANFAFLFWWAAYAGSPVLFDSPTFKLSLAPVRVYFFWGYLAITLFNIALAAVNMRRRYWTGLRATCRLTLDLAGGILFCWFMKADLVATLYIANLEPARTLAIKNAIHIWMDRCFPIAVIISAIAVVIDLMRIVRMNRKDRFIFTRGATALIALLLFTAASRAQQPSVAASVSQPLPSDSELQEILADRIDVQHQSVGMIVAITGPNGRRIVPFGRLNEAGSGKLSGDTVFEIGSVTKIFTALLLEDMVQRGEVSLNDPVVNYLPPNVKVPERNGRSITLLDLATQTSGLPFFPTDIPLNDPPAAERAVAAYPTSKVYDFLSQYQLTRDIGSKWEYSNLGFALLGNALARRAGRDYASLVKERITDPLGMKSTSITLSPEMHSRLATGYDVNLKPAPEIDMPAFVAAGCLHSTANDLLTLLEAFMNYRTSPLAPAMQEMSAPLRPGPGFQQALGWWIMSFGTADPGFVFHGGQTPGFSSAIAFDPRTRTGVVVLSNDTRDDGGLAWHLMRPNFPLADSASQKALQDEAHREITVAPKTLDLNTGRYRISSGPGAGEIITVQRTGDFLVMKSSTTPPAGLHLHARSDRVFFITETDLQLEFNSDAGKPASGIEIRFAGSSTPASRVSAATEN